MMLFLLLALLPLEATTNRVDVIELNHFYDCRTGHEVFSQWLFWDLNDGEWELVDWRLYQKSDIVFGNVLTTGGKTIKAELVNETWTDFDRELAAREKTPKEKRKKLR